MPDILLKIVVNEQQHEKRDATCRKLLEFLLEQGVPGATVKRGTAGLDDRGSLNYDLLEDSYFNDLPIIIESVMDNVVMEKIEGGLEKMTAHGQIARIEGINEENRDGRDHFIVKVYTKESGKLLKKGEYEKVLQLLQKHKAVWGTVTKAVAGYGSDRIIYGQHIFSPSEHLPLVIECIVDKEHLDQLLEELSAIVSEGAVFTAPVDLILNH